MCTYTSCLHHDLENLPEFEEAEITGIQRVEYRYKDQNDISVVDGEPIVKYVTLTNSYNIENNTVSIDVTVPADLSTLPEEERERISASNLSVMVAISTAARLTPVGNSPLLGTPGDWSKPNQYLVTSANGTSKTWTIRINNLTK
jgi:hypothetical protein